MTEPFTTYQIFIRKLTEIILTNLNNKDFGVKELARESGMSRSGLNRRLNKIIKKTISQFIREVRLQKALEMLQNESVTASEVAYKVGFSSPAYFNTCFHEFFGYPPGKVKKRSLESPEEDILTHVTARQEQKRPAWQAFAFSKLWILFLSVLIVIVGILIYPKIFKRKTLDDLRSSDGRIIVAVMPFQNITNDRIWDGVQINLISYLSNYEELTVRQKETIDNLLERMGNKDYASFTPSVARAISHKLDANVFIYGSIDKAGSEVRVNAQLINSKSRKVFRSFQIDGPSTEDEIFKIIDSVSVLVKNYLVISDMEKGISPDLKPYKYTNSPEAYRYFILAEDAFKRNDVMGQIDLYSKAVAKDSNFIPAIIFLSMRYEELGLYEDARKLCLIAYKKRDQTPYKDGLMAEWHHARYFETPDDEIKYLRQFETLDDQVPVVYWQIGNAYCKLFQYSKAIPEYEKTLEIYKKWGIKPMFVLNYTNLGIAYHMTGKVKEEKKLYKKAEQDFPDKPVLIYRQAVLALSAGDTVTANQYIEKFISVRKGSGTSEADITTALADIYSKAELLDKAEYFYRKALSLESSSAVRLNNLAYFLIDKGRDIDSGLELADKALELNPENYNYLHTQGWGLYKQGRYQEALDILLKSWELRKQYAIYNYDRSTFLHIEEVKRAIANKK